MLQEGDALEFCGTAPALWWSVLDGDAEGESETISHHDQNDVDGIDPEISICVTITSPGGG